MSTNLSSYTIRDIATICVGRDLVKTSFSEEKTSQYKYPVYSNSIESKGLYGFYDFGEYSANSLTVVGRGAGLGTAFPRSEGFGAIGRLLVLTPNNESFDVRYLSEYINNKLVIFNESGGIPQLPGESLAKYKVLLPPIWEQKAIADLLSPWDEAIEKNDRLIQAKERLFKGHIQRLISRQCNSWPHIKPKEMFDAVTEKNFPQEELLSVTQGRGVIPRGMLEGRVMSPDGTTANYKLIKRGDFAISLRSFQGGIEYSNYQGIISPAYTVLRPKIEMNTSFYKLFFKSYVFIEKYLNLAVIGIRDGKQISIPDFLSIKIPVPPIEEQREIAEALIVAKKEIELLKTLSEKYKAQKRGLMQKMLTGEWRVKPEIVNQYMEG
jgi:restriction endonuclease S subunit